jgi:hypothetical protein
MACPDSSIIQACDYPQFFIDQTPKFDEKILEDIKPTDGWLYNVSTGTTPMGTSVEITQDRMRSVHPNTTKQWRRVVANGVGCTGNPCDPPESKIGWGADRLTYYAEEQTWATPLICYNQAMHITHAMQDIDHLISKILKPATTIISSAFLRRRALQWAKYHTTANASMEDFTFQWTAPAAFPDEDIYFDCSVDPSNVYLLVPQMLQRNFSRAMLEGYAGENPFKETLPFIELVSDLDTVRNLERLGTRQGTGGGSSPSVIGNWRFSEWGAASEYWRYGFSGQVGNYLVRSDEMGLRFNFVTDLGAGAAPNRYRYQVLQPFTNVPTSGAGGAVGEGSEVNVDFQNAQFTLTYQMHKKGMELLVPDATPLNPEMPYGHKDFGGTWQFQMDNLGADASGQVIANPWRNKGRFAAWFKYYIRPLHTEFMRVYFHKREQECIPEIDTCSPDPGYPSQNYSSDPPTC